MSNSLITALTDFKSYHLLSYDDSTNTFKKENKVAVFFERIGNAIVRCFAKGSEEKAAIDDRFNRFNKVTLIEKMNDALARENAIEIDEKLRPRIAGVLETLQSKFAGKKYKVEERVDNQRESVEKIIAKDCLSASIDALKPDPVIPSLRPLSDFEGPSPTSTKSAPACFQTTPKAKIHVTIESGKLIHYEKQPKDYLEKVIRLATRSELDISYYLKNPRSFIDKHGDELSKETRGLFKAYANLE